jgi:hypothetical protein
VIDDNEVPGSLLECASQLRQLSFQFIRCRVPMVIKLDYTVKGKCDDFPLQLRALSKLMFYATSSICTARRLPSTANAASIWSRRE